MQKWIPVATRLPSPGERVLICLERGFVGEAYLLYSGKWGRYDELDSVEDIFHQQVSHWMPLPKPVQNGGGTIESKGLSAATQEARQADRE